MKYMEEKKRDIIVCAHETLVEPSDDVFEPNNPLHRPEVHYAKPVIALLVYIVQLVLLILIPYGSPWLCFGVLAVYSLAYFLFIAKRAIIWSVHLYQNKASDRTRLKCVMEPSCSEYMILAVQKYGAIVGGFKGVRRMFRCGHTRGVDYP